MYKKFQIRWLIFSCILVISIHLPILLAIFFYFDIPTLLQQNLEKSSITKLKCQLIKLCWIIITKIISSFLWFNFLIMPIFKNSSVLQRIGRGRQNTNKPWNLPPEDIQTFLQAYQNKHIQGFFKNKNKVTNF
jgi:hypothetical protein